jgi:hypothetical protein
LRGSVSLFKDDITNLEEEVYKDFKVAFSNIMAQYWISVAAGEINVELWLEMLEISNEIAHFRRQLRKVRRWPSKLREDE